MRVKSTSATKILSIFCTKQFGKSLPLEICFYGGSPLINFANFLMLSILVGTRSTDHLAKRHQTTAKWKNEWILSKLTFCVFEFESIY